MMAMPSHGLHDAEKATFLDPPSAVSSTTEEKRPQDFLQAGEGTQTTVDSLVTAKTS